MPFTQELISQQTILPSLSKFMQKASHSSKAIYSLDVLPEQPPKIAQRIRELEGECQITLIQPLKRNISKTVFMLIALILTFFGLLVLKYSAKFRKFVFYEQCNLESATHLFIIGKTAKDDIVPLEDPINVYPLKFSYKKLRYFLYSQKQAVPRALDIETRFNQFINPEKLKTGLTDSEVATHRELYGNNEHNVQIPNYFAYLLDVLTAPYFLLQYFFCLVFFLQGYAPFSIALLAFTALTATINYVLLYVSYRKIKSIAEQTFEVKVIRNGEQRKVLNTELVPGDIYYPKHEIPADSFIVQGDIYVNEANLTGESHPIGKFPIKYVEQIKNRSIWLYEGSMIVDQTEDTRAIVINTNFATHRGRIIRRILHREVKDPQMIRSLLFLTLEVVLVSLLVFFATIPILVAVDIQPLFRFFKFIDFLSSSAPPPLPIFFNIAYGLSLTRLRIYGIIGTEPQKTVDGAQVKTFCFDKTGTLTQSRVEIRKLLSLKKNLQFMEIDLDHKKLAKQQKLIWKLFSSCHTTRIIEGQVLGDEIDKEIFVFSQTQMQNSENAEVKFTISKKSRPEDIVLEVLKINQFQSKFQSNSVLVYDLKTKKYIIFVKGAPEKINRSSINSTSLVIHEVRKLSIEGFRTIGIAYKQIYPQELQKYIHADRSQFETDLTMLGLVAFENHLKDDTVETMQRLITSNIHPKMITGDNIYIAVQTARRAGIIEKNQKVVYLKGEDQKNSTPSMSDNPQNSAIYCAPRSFKGTILQDQQTEKEISLKQHGNYLTSNYVYAIDNAFLQLENKPFLTHQIKVFARISPENKAEIIRTYKKQDRQRREKSLNCFQKIIKYGKLKVGMCGDGANDLLALKQADLSVGIQETDASYGSSFTISNLLDVQHIIREAKCVQSNILELFQFYVPMTMTILLLSLVMLADTTYLSTAQLMYLNFSSVLLMAVCLTMSFPADEPINTAPDPNALNLHNHLLVWGHTIIPFLGGLGAYLYFFNTQEFKPNPNPHAKIDEGGFNSQNHTATLCFLMLILVVPISGFLIHRSEPYKKRIWWNPLLSLLIAINITAALFFPFFTSKLNQAFEIVQISIENIGICMGIMLGSLLILAIFNLIVNYFGLGQKYLGPEETNQGDQL